MSYDFNLNPVLEKASNEDLNFLVDLIIDTMTNMLCIKDEYIKYAPNHSKYTHLIADEIRAFGGNTFANLFRGGDGPSYEEIVGDVAAKLKAPHPKNCSIERMEDAILETVLTQALEKMSDAEKRELLKEIGGGDVMALTGQGVTAAFITIFRLGGFKSYQLTVIIVNAVLKAVIGRGLALTGNAILTKALSIVTGPIGWVVTGVWTAIDIAGPATRVTIPAVVYIAMLRKKYNTPSCPHCNKMIAPGSKFCPDCGGAI